MVKHGNTAQSFEILRGTASNFRFPMNISINCHQVVQVPSVFKRKVCPECCPGAAGVMFLELRSFMRVQGYFGY